jgi:hypothetical protein
MHHKLIINGYTKTGFKVLNVYKGKKYNLNFDKFLLAFYSEHPELLIIKPKKKSSKKKVVKKVSKKKSAPKKK